MEGLFSLLLFAGIFYLMMRFGCGAHMVHGHGGHGGHASVDMFEAWRRLLPGFEWLTWKSFLLGLVESYAYGWYVALIWVPIYNVFARRGPQRPWTTMASPEKET
ncbi:MAG: hypothetical protein V3V96_16940 [Acidiferrobacterales bacterium]